VTEPILDVRSVHHEFTAGQPVIADVGFSVNPGEAVCIVGPSGCGKTTLLRILAGLIAPTSGTIFHSGSELVGVNADTAVVFQDYRNSLYPWMRVRENVEFPLRGRFSKKERTELADAALESVGLASHTRKHPWELSGGMQQRVAIARALVVKPDLLLMDEPFASVDAQTRSELEDLVLDISTQMGLSMVVVTHDIDESVYLADRVVVLSGGPTSVLEVITTDLPRPRDQIATKSSAEFLANREHVITMLRSTT